MDVGPIPWTAVSEYAARHRLSEDEFDDVWRMVRALELVMQDFRAKRRDAPKQTSDAREAAIKMAREKR